MNFHTKPENILIARKKHVENFLIKRKGRFGGSQMGRGTFCIHQSLLDFHTEPENILIARKDLWSDICVGVIFESEKYWCYGSYIQKQKIFL